MEQFLGALAEPWARRWGGQVAGPALAFWAAGFLIYIGREGASALRCPAPGAVPAVWCRAAHSGGAGSLLLVLAVAATVIGSASIMTAFAPRLIYLLAGNGWPIQAPAAMVAGPLVRWLTRRQIERRGRIASAGTQVPVGGPAIAEGYDRRRRAHRAIAAHAAAAQLDRAAVAKLRRYPAATESVGLTRIGNSLAAMSERVWRRHGLDLSVCWEPLIAVLPADARESLARESTRVTLQGQNLGWALAALTWTPALAAPLGVVLWVASLLVVLRILYAILCTAMDNYCDLIEATVAVHRSTLYRALGLEPPESTSLEPVSGALLTDYLACSRAADLSLSWPLEAAPDPDAAAER